MFGRRDRLVRTHFPSKQSAAHHLQSAHLSVLVPLHGHGYAVVTPKKVFRRAVDRHRAKRRVLATLRLVPTNILPLSLVVFPRASILTLDAKTLLNEFTALLQPVAHS